MSLINRLRIVGDNNIVFQDIDGSQINTTIKAFISNITAEKDERIADLKRTIEDKTEIQHLSRNEIQRLGRELTQLKEERLSLKKHIEEMLREFDGKDLSTTSKIYQEAFNLFVSGKLREAIDFLTEDKMAAEEKQQAQIRRLKADMLVLNFDFAGAAHNYEKAVALFPSWGNYGTAANFYCNQKNYQKAEHHYLSSLDYAENDEQKAGTLNNLGNYYRNTQKMHQAEAAYTEALSLYRQLVAPPLHAFLPDVAMILNNLGNYYSVNQKMPEAEAAYLEAFSLYRQLAAKDSATFLPHVAGTLNNLGNYYYSNQMMQHAEAAYTKALSLRRQLADQDPDTFLSDFATTLYNLASFYLEIPEEAQKYLKESLSIRRELAQLNPDAQNLELARTLIVGGFLDKSMGNTDQSQEYFKEALSIVEPFSEVPLAQQLIEIAKENIQE
jgi:tetratricopeptide (TPR) repeat protein